MRKIAHFDCFVAKPNVVTLSGWLSLAKFVDFGGPMYRENRNSSGGISAIKVRGRIAHVSTFPPLKCGIASFVSDLISATPNFQHFPYRLHYGHPGFSQEAVHADVNSLDNLATLARLISASDCDIVSLQHEFGIWGGSQGENIHAFLDNLTKPLLSVLHTTFGPGSRSPIQDDIVRRLVRQSRCVVVLTDKAKKTAEQLCGGRSGSMVVVPHGIPEFPYVTPPRPCEKHGLEAHLPLCLVTPGFFREDKGIEVILYAVHDLRHRGFNVSYRIAGAAQPQFESQMTYRAKIEGLIKSMQLDSIVQIDGRYLSLPEQAACIQQAHVGIFAYQDASHASSGTVPLVMGMGRPVLCTPFEYAKAKAQEGPGVFLADGFDSASMASAVERFAKLDEYRAIARAIYSRTRPWTWSAVGKSFEQLYSNLRPSIAG
jgi:glycosyltransferase involved in cell wall biosynthesis